MKGLLILGLAVLALLLGGIFLPLAYLPAGYAIYLLIGMKGREIEYFFMYLMFFACLAGLASVIADLF